MEAKLKHRLGEGTKIMGGVGRLVSPWGYSGMTVDVKMGMLKRVVIWYGSESFVLNRRKRKIMGVFDMKCLRKVLGVGGTHRIMNRDIRGKYGKIYRWFDHTEVNGQDSYGRRGLVKKRGRLKRRWSLWNRGVLVWRNTKS